MTPLEVPIQSFAQDGINTDYVSSIPSTPTGVALIQVSDEGENSICLSPEANNALDQIEYLFLKIPSNTVIIYCCNLKPL